jgi:hypothetical protein
MSWARGGDEGRAIIAGYRFSFEIELMTVDS